MIIWLLVTSISPNVECKQNNCHTMERTTMDKSEMYTYETQATKLIRSTTKLEEQINKDKYNNKQMEETNIINNILSNSKSQTNKKARLDAEAQAESAYLDKRNLVLDKYTPQKYDELKLRMLTAARKGETKVYFGAPGSKTNYDGVFLSAYDFVDGYRLLMAKEPISPHMHIVWHYDCVEIVPVQSIHSDYPETGFYEELRNNLHQHNLDEVRKKQDRENKEVQEAQDTYKVVLNKMSEAAKLGLSEIEYQPLFDTHTKQHVSWSNDRNFEYHKKWLYSANNNIVVKLRRTNSYFSAQGAHYNLCWREKYLHEKLIDGVWSSMSQ